MAARKGSSINMYKVTEVYKCSLPKKMYDKQIPI